jgi:integrase
LEGDPGSHEFYASYAEAWKSRCRSRSDRLQYVLDEFRRSPDFAALAPRTQKDYSKHLLGLEAEFGDLPLEALSDRRARGDILAWRDRLAAKSRRQADYAFAILARTLAWARNRGLVTVNPCERAGRVYRSKRNDKIWTFQHELDFYSSAPRHLHAALALALWTGQRQGDLLRLKWRNYDGSTIRLLQGKTGAPVVIPVSEDLREHLERVRPASRELHSNSAEDVTILRTESGSQWTESGFRASWRKACIKVGIVGLSFHDLRGTAVTRLAEAGCSVPEIATITGHSLKDVGSILDRHYLNRSSEIGRTAMAKLERFHAMKQPVTAQDAR